MKNIKKAIMLLTRIMTDFDWQDGIIEKNGKAISISKIREYFQSNGSFFYQSIRLLENNGFCKRKRFDGKEKYLILDNRLLYRFQTMISGENDE
ncbi:MAG: hypothetical protein ACK5HP_01770 [Bacilli bacterium]